MAEMDRGSVVILKSGGPIMTVRYLADDLNNPKYKLATCNWFNTSGELIEKIFSVESLAPAPV